jgi:hypothetical protein
MFFLTASNRRDSLSSGIHSQSSFSEENFDLNCSEEMLEVSSVSGEISSCLDNLAKQKNTKEATLDTNKNMCVAKDQDLPAETEPSLPGIEEASNNYYGLDEDQLDSFEDIIDEILESSDPLKYIPSTPLF